MAEAGGGSTGGAPALAPGAAALSGTRLVLETLRWLAGVWLLWSVRRCDPVGTDHDGDQAAGAAVIVPARDEASTLPCLLASLAVQRHALGSVVVVDDGSTDATAEVARRAGATVVACEALPEGWTGKSWACWTGAGAARDAAVLVFLDADTELEPGGLDRLLAEHRRRGGLVSVQPFHETARLYERLSAYFNVVAMMGVDAFSPRRDREPRGAFGPCLVTSRHDYLAVGGHQAVRSEVVEDVALARLYAAAGRRVSCIGGRGTVRFRMYPAGLGQLVEGWSKNFAAGAGATRPLTFALVAVWLSGNISAAWYLGRAVAGTAGGPGIVAAAGLYAAYAAQLWWMLARIGRFGWSTAVAFPVPLLFFLVVFARSIVLTNIRGEVTWRGRRITTRR